MANNMAENKTKDLERRMRGFIRRTLNDIKVEAKDEFDRNFQREAFFNERWARRKYNPDESRGLLVQTGVLSRSIRAEVMPDGKGVSFTSSEPYARIHNEGGTITVTRRMKGYFWKLYREAVGAKTFRRDGSPRQDRKNRQLTSAAEFYKAMALKKVGSKITIPRRQFIGRHPDLERLLEEIIQTNVKEMFNP